MLPEYAPQLKTHASKNRKVQIYDSNINKNLAIVSY